MAFPTFQAIGSAAESATADISPAWPTHLTDDVAILLIESNNWPVQLSAPAGFKELPCSPQRHGRPGTTTAAKLHAYWCRATSAAMGAPTATFVADHHRAIIFTVRGCGATETPVHVSSGKSVASTTSLSWSSVTTTDADCLIALVCGHGTDSASAQGSGYTNGALASITERHDSSSVIGAGSGFILVTGTKATAGAVGATTGTLGTAATHGLMTIAFSAVVQAEDIYPHQQAIGTFVESATADISPAWPTHQTDDIGLLIVEGGAWPQTLATASGFAEIVTPSSPINAGSSNSSAGTALSVYWCRATSGAMSAPTVDFIGNHIRAGIITVRAAKTTGNPINVSAGSKITASADVTVPGATTTTVKTLIVLIVGASDDNATIDTVIPDSWTAGSGLENLVEKFDLESTIGGGSGSHMSVARKPTAGAYGASIATADTNPNTHLTFMSFAIESSTEDTPPPPEMSAFIRAAGAGAWEGGSPSGASLSATLAAVVASGHSIIGHLVYSAPDPTQFVNITDNQDNVYSIIRARSFRDNAHGNLFGLQNITNGPLTLTANFSSEPAWAAFMFHVVSGVEAVSPVDVSAIVERISIGTGGGALTTPNVITTLPGDYIYAGAAITEFTSAKFTAGAGFTERLEIGNSTDIVDMQSQDQVQATAGTIRATWTLASAFPNVLTFIAALKASSAAEEPDPDPEPPPPPILPGQLPTTFLPETMGERVTFFEIDQAFCSLVYGVTPCNAVLGVTGTHKCYNTRKTCQDPTNYSPNEKRGTVTVSIASPGVFTWTGHGLLTDTPISFSTTGTLPTGIPTVTIYYVRNPAANTFEVAATIGAAVSITTTGSQSGVHTATAEVPLTLRFSRSQEGLQQYGNVFPSMSSIDTMPASINLAGMNRSAAPLGQREQVTVKLDDMLHSDHMVDKYRHERLTGAAYAEFGDHFYLPGSASNYAWTADSGLFPTGDIDVRAKVAAVDYSPAAEQVIVSKWNVTGNQRSVYLSVTSAALLQLSWSANGTTVISKVSTTIIPTLAGEDVHLRATLDVNNGAAGNTVTFYTSADEIEWTVLGSPVVTASTTSIYNSTATLAISGISSGATLPFAGKVYKAEIRSGIAGTLVASFDPKLAPDGVLSWATKTGETWTVNQSGGTPAALVLAEGAFNPYDRGTFWGKWIARNPYYTSFYCRVREGHVGQTLNEMDERHYVIDRVEGPGNGVTTVVAKDLFSRIEAKKAVAPFVSKGELASDITSAQTTATLASAGLSEPDYPAAGIIAIGNECMTFSRSGGALTIARAQLNTKAEEHKTGDVVQLVLSFVSQRAHDIVYNLLTVYGGVDPSWINKTEWDIAAASLTELYTAHIATPTPVIDLIGELSQQAGFTSWIDVATGMVKFSALRAPTATTVVDDGKWIIDDNKLSVKRQDNKRVTQIWVYYALINPTDGLDDRKNYRSRVAPIDIEAEAENEYGTPVILEIFCRWIPAGGRVFAEAIGLRILSLFRDPPLEAKFSISAARSRQLQLAKYFLLETAEVQDGTGALLRTTHAVIELDKKEDTIGVRSQQIGFRFTSDVGTGGGSGGGGGGGVVDGTRVIYIENDSYNINLRTVHDSIYALPVGNETVVVNVAPGTVVGSSNGDPAMVTGTWPAGVVLKLVNNWKIYGRAGDGGSGAWFVGNNGTAGGDAIHMNFPMTIDNTNGNIWAGGGGGGAGGSGFRDLPGGENAAYSAGGGGGGQGVRGGNAGAMIGALPGAIYNNLGTHGGGGSETGPGAGGLGGYFESGDGLNGAGNGGAGGEAGLPGQAGGTAYGAQLVSLGAGGAGGAGGLYAVKSNGHAITWLGGNNINQVKGSTEAPPPTTVEADFVSSFETTTTERTTPTYSANFWTRESADVSRVALSTLSSRDGAKAVRFTTLGNDVNIAGSGSGRERCEIRLSLINSGAYPGITQWWSVSIYLPADYVFPLNNWENAIVTQWHSAVNAGQPMMMLEVTREPTRGVCWRMRFNGGQVTAEHTPRIYPFPGETPIRGVWYDLTMNVKWSNDNTGFWKCWMAKEGETLANLWADKSNIQTCYGSNSNYLKVGTYHNVHGSVTHSVIIDRVVKGTSSAIATTALE